MVSAGDGETPRAVRTPGGLRRQVFAHSPFAQILNASSALPCYHTTDRSLRRNQDARPCSTEGVTVVAVPEPSPQVSRDLLDHLRETDAPVLRVCSRIRFLKRAMALEAMRRRGSRSPVKPNPRNFLCTGRATALFAWFTLSLSRCVMSAYALHHSLARSFAVDVDVASSASAQRGDRAAPTLDPVRPAPDAEQRRKRTARGVPSSTALTIRPPSHRPSEMLEST